MSSKGKYIGLNQRIPFDVLDSAIHNYLDRGSIDKNAILISMHEHTSGANRASKAANYVFQILNRQKPIVDQLRKELGIFPYSSLRINDRKAFCLCLICLTFPIAYDMLTAISQGLKVQSMINRKLISEKVMSIYGSNRTVDIAIDALIPIVIELNTITRYRVGIYALAEKSTITNKYIADLVIYVDIKLSGSKSLLYDELAYKPWFAFFDMSGISPAANSALLSKRDSAVGKGYLTISG
jgi:hypothetical protein